MKLILLLFSPSKRLYYNFLECCARSSRIARLSDHALLPLRALRYTYRRGNFFLHKPWGNTRHNSNRTVAKVSNLLRIAPINQHFIKPKWLSGCKFYPKT